VFKTMKQVTMKQVAITKAALAAELDCPRGTITRLCQRGMPTLKDGRLNRAETLRWMLHYCSGAGGGWIGGRRGKASIYERAKALLEGKPAPKAGRPRVADRREPSDELVVCREELLDYIRAHAADRLPILARELGLPEYVARDAFNVFDCLLAGCGASDLTPDYEWNEVGDCGEPMTPKQEKQADALLERIDAFCNNLRAADKDPDAAH
jgi:hypothetical protein